MNKLGDLVGKEVVILTDVSEKVFKGILITVDEVQGWLELENNGWIKNVRLKNIVGYSYEKPEKLSVQGTLNTDSVV